MTLINRLYVHGLLPWFERERNAGLGRRMKELRKWEWLSPDEIRARQWERLVTLLRHAKETSPFYRHRFENIGFDPHFAFDASDLKHIPPLTREDIKLNLSEMRSRRYSVKQLSMSATGGTTDTPVTFYRDRESLREKNAVQRQLDTWAAMYPGDKVFYFWGARSDYAQNPSWRWVLYDQHFMRRRWAPTSMLTQEIAEDYRCKVNRFKPRIIYGYPSPLALFCKYVRESGRPLHTPAAVICTAELLLDSDREVIEQTLGCRVFLHYGAREFGMIAAECEEHSGLHFASPAAYVEYLPLPNKGEEGLCEILVTDLLNYGMPLIRYRVNDCGVPQSTQCRCGRGYPVVQSIVGRTADLFYLPDGSIVPGISLQNRVLQVCPELKKIQVVQNTLHDFTVRYVPGERVISDGITVLKKNLQTFFPSQVLHWTFEEVADIEREPSGKTRFCISNVSRESRLSVPLLHN
jgi:phenylacetate-CoA ligase